MKLRGIYLKPSYHIVLLGKQRIFKYNVSNLMYYRAAWEDTVIIFTLRGFRKIEASIQPTYKGEKRLSIVS